MFTRTFLAVLMLSLLGCAPRVFVRPEVPVQRPSDESWFTKLEEVPEEHAEQVDQSEHARAAYVPQSPLIRPRQYRTDGNAETSRLGQSSFAFFEFAPSDGTGMGAACACTTPTGAKGEALTFTRASNGTCTKTATGGLSTTGIANGDLVVCTNNQPRVEYDSQGVLGLLVESSRTNSLIRSQEADNAAWSSITTAGAVTVTADFGVAPDGTTTADRVQFAACPTLTQSSSRGQVFTGIASNAAGSVYIKGNGTSGNLSVILGQGSYTSATCAYNSTTWTRCVVADARATISEFFVGCHNTAAATPNPGNTGSGDVLVWGGQAEAGAYVTSYIPTVGATVPRATEVPATFGPQTFGITTNKASVAFSMQDVVGTAAQVPILMQNVFEIFSTRPTYQVYHYPAATFFGTLTIPASGVNRFATAADGTNRTNCMNGTCESTAVVNTNFASSPWTLTIGGEGAAKPVNSIISRICIDPDASRCR